MRSAREPMLAQLRLAWWRDRLAEDPAAWPKGEPLLARLGEFASEARRLVPLVDGWEALLVDPPLPPASLEEFARGRACALGALATHLGTSATLAELAGHQWALADLALHLGNPDERAAAIGLNAASSLPRLPTTLRPLSLLAGLSLRAVRRGSGDALDGLGAMASAIRLGFLGR